MSDGRGYGTGQWRGPATIPDRLAPGQPPPPSTGAQGPSISVPFEAWEKQNETINKLGQALATLNRYEDVIGVATGETDGSGNLYLGIYNVAAGMEARLTRLTLNATNPSTGVGYTPASPYAAAGGYLTVHQAESANANAVSGSRGSMIDFGPDTVGATIFPSLFTYSEDPSMRVIGPSWFVLHVNGGPASTMVVARYQVKLSRLTGFV